MKSPSGANDYLRSLRHGNGVLLMMSSSAMGARWQVGSQALRVTDTAIDGHVVLFEALASSVSEHIHIGLPITLLFVTFLLLSFFVPTMPHFRIFRVFLLVYLLLLLNQLEVLLQYLCHNVSIIHFG